MKKKTAKTTRPEIQPVSMEEFQKREALKPCPLCKGKPEHQLGITCTECGLRLTPKVGETWEDIRDKWNERPQEESIIEDFDNRAETIRELLEDVLNLKMMMESDKAELAADEGFYLASQALIEKTDNSEDALLVQDIWCSRLGGIENRYATNLESLKDIVSTLREEVTTYSEMYE